MSKVITIKKEVERIKQRILPKPPVDHVLVLSFGSDDEPHGPFGHRKQHVSETGKGRVESCSMEEEIAQLKDFYENQIPQHAKRKHEGTPNAGIQPYSWATFEDYLEACRCKCGKHGQSGLEPYER